MNELAALFKSDEITFVLDGEEFRLVYDLNAFCELEKIYPSMDDVLQLLFGTGAIPELDTVTYNGAQIRPEEVMIGRVPLTEYILKVSPSKQAKSADTRNLLWAGCLHDSAVYDDFGEISRYTVSKTKLASAITFKNLREINAKIITAIIRDITPKAEDEKNVQVLEEVNGPLEE